MQNEKKQIYSIKILIAWNFKKSINSKKEPLNFVL